MRRPSQVRLLATIGLLLLGSIWVQPLIAGSRERYRVCVKRLALRENERIGGFEIDLVGARIVSLEEVPLGWYVVLDNDPAWTPTIKGTISVGAAALYADGLKISAVVEMEPQDAAVPGARGFEVRGEVATTIDFEKDERRIKLTTKDFEIVRLAHP